MRKSSTWMLLSACAAMAACTSAPAPVSEPPAAAMPMAADNAAASRPATPGYIPGNAADLFNVLPPAPQDGDARDEADRRIFRDTRAQQGSARWQMAIDDADLSPAAMLRHFACSLDVQLEPQQAPQLLAVLQKATREAAASMGRAKDYYKRHRPFTVDAGATCVPPASVGKSYDYPSGHTTAGWAWALVLAQVEPQRAGAVLARGRAIGDSRVVCGMHNASAVEGARMLTSAALAAAAGSPLFQADVAAARSELAALRARPHARPEAAACAAEAELVKPYW